MRFIGLLAALLLAAAPVAAQEISVPAAASGGANQNLDNTTESCGFDAVGVKTPVAAAGSNTKTATPVSLCTTASDWTDFVVYVTSATSTTRYLLDICSTSNCSTVIAPNIYIEPNAGSPTAVIPVPLNVAAGSTLYIRQQDNSGTNSINVALVGTVRNSQSAPGFNTMTALNADTSATNACTSTVSVVGSGLTIYTTVTASTAATYGAFLVIPGRGSANPTNNQAILMRLAKGAASSETILTRAGIWSAASASPFNRQTGTVTFASVPSGSRISAQLLGSATGDNGCVGVYAFN